MAHTHARWVVLLENGTSKSTFNSFTFNVCGTEFIFCLTFSLSTYLPVLKATDRKED